jgi:hypothetical protein
MLAQTPQLCHEASILGVAAFVVSGNQGCWGRCFQFHGRSSAILLME